MRTAHDDGPQVVTRHGEDVAVIVAIDDYRRMTGRAPDFKEFLLTGPDLSDLHIERSTEVARIVELG